MADEGGSEIQLSLDHYHMIIVRIVISVMMMATYFLKAEKFAESAFQ